MKKPDLIYFAARELQAGERPAYLARACKGEPALRTRVEEMLALSNDAEAFFSDLPDAELDAEGGRPGRTPAGLADDVIGQKIGGYKILERIGEGGCGVVYVAEQTEPLRRSVALKVIKAGMDTRQVVARFQAERQALAMMDHPNIASVFDAGTTGTGRPFFVMELVRGICFTEYCDQNNLPTKERLELFIKVCQAIQHAHQKGIIHRDIKPSNILVTLHDGVPVPKVIDFGIAKATEGRLTEATVYTQLHQFIGTPAYMSPEQAEICGLDIDTRSDIYSLGVLLYELLAGRTPFDARELVASGFDAMRKTIREQEPVRPSTRLKTLTINELNTTARRRAAEAPKLIRMVKGDLDWIVMKCLEKDRGRRYETANGLAADLKRHLHDEPVTAGPPDAVYALGKFAARNRWPVIFIATAAALIIAGLIGTSVGLRRATAARKVADQNAARATQLAGEAKASAAAALGLAYSASMLAACDALQNGQIDTARHYLEIAPTSGRGWEWRLLTNRLDLSVRFQRRARSPGSRIHLLPDGQSYYDVGPRGIQRWDTESGQLLATITTAKTCKDSWLVAGGKQMLLRVAAMNGGAPSVERWDLERGSLLSSWVAPDHFTPDPDGLRLAGQNGTNIFLMDSRASPAWSSGATVFESVGVPGAMAFMCFEPDGRRLAVAQELGDVTLLDADTLGVRSTFPAHDNSLTCLDFSADSRLLATGSLDKTIRITDVAVNPPTPVATLRGHADWVTGLCFSPDGSLLASTAKDRTLRLWDTRTGLARGVFRSDGDCPRFLPDGQTLMNGEPDGVHFWDVPSLDAWVLRGHFSYVYSVVISPDGGTIYSGGWDGFSGQPGSVRFWDAATGDLIGAEGAAGDYVRAVVLSPDGSRLAASIELEKGGGRIDILDTGTGTTALTVTKLGTNQIQRGLESLAFDLSGRNLICVDQFQGTAFMINAATGGIQGGIQISRQVASAGSPKSCLAWSPDGKTIAVGFHDQATISLLDGKSLAPLRQWPHGHRGGVTSVAFSPDSRRILTTAEDGIVRVWDAATGAQLHDLVGHANRVLCAAYSPDGLRIASGGFDNDVLIWNAQTFDQVARLGGHQDYVHALAWRADSQQLVSGSGDHTIRIWDTQPLKDRVQARRERQSILVEVEPMVQRLFTELGDAGKVVGRVRAADRLAPRARQIALQVALRISLDQISAGARADGYSSGLHKF